MTSLFPNTATRTLCRSLIDDRCLPADNAALRKRKCRSSSLPLSLSRTIPLQRALRHDYANCMQLQSLCVTVRRSRRRSIDRQGSADGTRVTGNAN